MDNYQVKLTARARRDLDGIYAYIAGTLLEPGTAIQMIEARNLCESRLSSVVYQELYDYLPH